MKIKRVIAEIMAVVLCLNTLSISTLAENETQTFVEVMEQEHIEPVMDQWGSGDLMAFPDAGDSVSEETPADVATGSVVNQWGGADVLRPALQTEEIAAEAVEGEIAEAGANPVESMEISGGAEGETPSENAAEITALTLTGEGTPVAQIGEKTYATLKAAVEAAEDGNTITLLSDVIQDESFEVSHRIAFDLAGKTLTINAEKTLTVGADLVITNSGGTAGGIDHNGTIAVNSPATLDISALNDGDGGLLRGKPGKLTIASGATVRYLTAWDHWPDDVYPVYAYPRVAIGEAGAYAFYKGATYVCTAAGTESAASTWAKAEVAKIGDKTYASLEDAIAAAESEDTITLLMDVTGIGITVSGGKKFTIDFAAHKYTATPPAAGSAGTESQAFQLLEGSEITFSNGTIDCSLYNKTAPMSVLPIQMIIQNYGTLTLQDMVIDGTNIAHRKSEKGDDLKSYLVSTNNGLTTIAGTTITANAGDVAFDSFYYFEKYEKAPTVIVTNSASADSVSANSVISGDVEAVAGEIIIDNGTQISGRIISAAREINLAQLEGVVVLGSGAKTDENDPNIASADGHVTIKGGSMVSDIDANTGIITVKGNSKISGTANSINGGWLSVCGEKTTIEGTINVDARSSLLDIGSGFFGPVNTLGTEAEEAESIEITGGYFKEAVHTAWMPADRFCIANTDPDTRAAGYHYVVTPTAPEAKVATADGAETSYYASVEEAIGVTSQTGSEYDRYNNATITLLKAAAVEEPNAVRFDRPVTFDLGGCTLTVTNNDSKGNILIYADVTVRNGHITTTQESITTRASSVFQIQEGKTQDTGNTLKLQSIDFRAYCPVSLAMGNAKAVIEDLAGSTVSSNYQVYTLIAAHDYDLAGNKSLTINTAGNFNIKSWAYDADDFHNAYTVDIQGGNFIIGSWNNVYGKVAVPNKTTITAGRFSITPDVSAPLPSDVSVSGSGNNWISQWISIGGENVLKEDLSAAIYKYIVEEKTGTGKLFVEACVKAQNLANTDIYYPTLDRALSVADAADPETTADRKIVKLANSFTYGKEQGCLIPAGLTLDLAGCVLTCKSYSSATGAFTKDSTAGVGAINSDSVTMEAHNNGYMAINDPGTGYRFFPYAMRKGGPSVPDTAKPNRIRIQYVIDMKDANGVIDHYSDAYKLLAAGNAACGLTFVTDVDFRGKTYQFKYESADTMKVYGMDQKNNPTSTKAISAYFNVNALKSGDVFGVNATVQGEKTGFSYMQNYEKTFE